ncbi:unnamed protein product [Chrysoparadoxa australica]
MGQWLSKTTKARQTAEKSLSKVKVIDVDIAQEVMEEELGVLPFQDVEDEDMEDVWGSAPVQAVAADGEPVQQQEVVQEAVEQAGPARRNEDETEGVCPICCEEATLSCFKSLATEHWDNKPCDHRVCLGCLVQYVEGMISEGKCKIRCPMGAADNGCNYFLFSGDVERLTSPAMYERYQAIRNADFTSRHAEILADDEDEDHKCIREICSPCPTCKVFIYKYDGCSAMLCVCGTHFCHHCGAVWCKCGQRCFDNDCHCHARRTSGSRNICPRLSYHEVSNLVRPNISTPHRTVRGTVRRLIDTRPRSLAVEEEEKKEDEAKEEMALTAAPPEVDWEEAVGDFMAMLEGEPPQTSALSNMRQGFAELNQEGGIRHERFLRKQRRKLAKSRPRRREPAKPRCEFEYAVQVDIGALTMVDIWVPEDMALPAEGEEVEVIINTLGSHDQARTVVTGSLVLGHEERRPLEPPLGAREGTVIKVNKRFAVVDIGEGVTASVLRERGRDVKERDHVVVDVTETTCSKLLHERHVSARQCRYEGTLMAPFC